jgi:predicted AAA+ superfamily ATPase
VASQKKMEIKGGQAVPPVKCMFSYWEKNRDKMVVLDLPPEEGSLVTIVAPMGCGKTSLIKYLLLENIHLIGFVLIFSNTGLSGYERNYSFINKKYVRTKFDIGFIREKVLPLATDIHNNDPKKKCFIIFDDCVGMVLLLYFLS